MNEDQLESLAARLEASGRYRVLRRLDAVEVSPGDLTSARLGIYLDLETTGLDATRDEIIEAALVPFRYDEAGRLLEVGEPLCGFREPSRPIPSDITRLTGITDEMVAGHTLDPDALARFIAPAAVIVAHNASFDRAFAEQFCSAFQGKPWACSLSQVDWKAEGFEGAKLAYLAAQCGFFYTGHRARHDCEAALQILARPLPSGGTALSAMLAKARRTTWRIWAEHAPFAMKDALKARGYRWNGAAGPAPRAWWIEVDAEARDAEIAYLQKEIYQSSVEPLMRRVTAYERFSNRL